MGARRFRGIAALSLLALLLVALVAASGQLLRGWRIDLTERGLYTLSEGSRQVLAEIGEPVTLHLFYSNRASEGLPWLRIWATRVREFLEEVEAAAQGRVRLEVIDPIPFSEAEDQATRYGMQAAPLGPGGENLYLGLAGTNPIDGLAAIPFLQPAREPFLEYDVMKLVQTLGRAERPVVGVVSSLPLGIGVPQHLRQQLQTLDWTFITELEQIFTLQQIPRSATVIEPELDVLLVIHPVDLEQDLLYAIDQYVLGGGHVLAFLDPQAELVGPQAATTSDLGPLLKSWGVAFDPHEVVLDPELALTVAGADGRPNAHPAYLRLDGPRLSREDVVTAELNALHVAAGGRLAPLPDAATTFEPLLMTTSSASTIARTDLTGPGAAALLMATYQPGREPLILAARVRGHLSTAFPDRAEDDPGHRAESASPANIVLVADVDMLSDPLWVEHTRLLGRRIASAFADNGNLAVNALDNLLGSSALIGIRAQGTSTRPFDRVETLRREAQARFQATEQRLLAELEETDRRLGELQTGRSAEEALILSPEQQAELERFRQENLRIRQELRQVRRQLDADIEALGQRVRLVNIALMPLLVALLAIALATARAIRRRR